MPFIHVVFLLKAQSDQKDMTFQEKLVLYDPCSAPQYCQGQKPQGQSEKLSWPRVAKEAVWGPGIGEKHKGGTRETWKKYNDMSVLVH